MANARLTTQLTEIIRPAVEAVGFELWGLEYLPQGKHSVLRVYIDHEQGITLDDCEKASKQVSAVLDVEDPISSHYNLEMSSPGLDRPLFTADQFQHYCGETIHCQLQQPIAGKRRYTGQLLEVRPDGVSLRLDDGQQVELTFAVIGKAKLVPKL